MAERGAPKHLRMDNGSELTAHALQDWCRFSKTGTAYIHPGSPWQNPYVESFHSRKRDELLDVEEFSCLAEAKVVISDWREDYNQRRPHSALGDAQPRRVRRRVGHLRAPCRRLTSLRLAVAPSTRGRRAERAATIAASPSRLRRSTRDEGRDTPPRHRVPQVPTGPHLPSR